MTKYSFIPSAPSELLDIDTTSRILSVSPERIRQLVQDGSLRGRIVAGELRIDSASVDRYSDKLDVQIRKPESEVFVKVAGKAYREVQTSRGIKLIPVR